MAELYKLRFFSEKNMLYLDKIYKLSRKHLVLSGVFLLGFP